MWHQEPPAKAEALLPPSCAILLAATEDIQANSDGLVESEYGVGVLMAIFDTSKTTLVEFAIWDETTSSNNYDSDDGSKDQKERKTQDMNYEKR